MFSGDKIHKRRDLEKILAACATRPATDGAPPGWMAFGRHVDDGIGAASSQAMIDWFVKVLEYDWIIQVVLGGLLGFFS